MQQPRYKLEIKPPSHYNADEAFPRLERHDGKRRKRVLDVNGDTAESLRCLSELALQAWPAELRTLSEELLQITLHAERLCENMLVGDSTEHVAKVARTAWLCAARLRHYALRYRNTLSTEHRIALWIARLRCVGLASTHCLEMYDECAHSEHSSTSSSSSASPTVRAAHATQGKRTAKLRQARLDAVLRYDDAQRDKELYAAHALLWPNDTPQSSLAQWCSQNGLLMHTVKDVDASLRECSEVTFWQSTKLLLSKWCELPYCAQLIAYYYRLLERAASLSMYSGDIQIYNHPLLARALGAEEYCISDTFLSETERTFFALDVDLHRCTYAQWPGPRGLRPRTHRNADHPSALQGDEAVERFNEFIWKELSDGRFLQYIDKDFKVVIWDHLLYPGEMERFEILRPYDDRKPLTVVSRTRRNDFDRYQKLFIDPTVKEVWQYLIKEKMYAHPAYTVIASRVLQYYFDATFDGASFDAYFLALDGTTVEHLRSSVSSALRDFNADMNATLTRGSARHALCGTFIRSGMQCTKDSHYPHPLIVRCIGASAVMKGENAEVIEQVGVRGRQTFATAFLTWLREFCGDERLAGTLANGQTVASLLHDLKPTRDSERVALRAMQIRSALNEERSNLTGLEREVKRISKAVPQKSDSNKVVF